VSGGDGVRTVAIAGLGLIGGSLARDLAARGVRVLGADVDRGTVDAALCEGVLSAALGEDWGGLEDADVFVLAVPVRAAPALLESALPRLDGVRLITDAGSTKTSIVAAARRLGLGATFVGAHPLAGDHRSGWASSRPGSFDGATVYITPTDASTADAVSLARALWTSVGGMVTEIGVDEHDRRLAWTSHLPQVVSSVLAAALAEQGIARGDLGPGGRDVTRLAASSPAMWRDILADNAAAVADAIGAVERRLASIRTAIESGDEAAIRAWLADAKMWGAPPE
jgi:prephenate dehydrogenase